MASDDQIDIGGLFRSSITITFVIQILSFIIMIGSVAAYTVGGFLPTIDPDIMILLFLLGTVITLFIFLAAINFFLRFSRKISYRVFPPGVDFIELNKPKVKPIMWLYAMTVGVMGVLGIWVWWIIQSRFLTPWAESLNSISLLIFSFALGAFFIALLIQIIIAIVGRTASKMILGVLAEDDSEFLE